MSNLLHWTHLQDHIAELDEADKDQLLYDIIARLYLDTDEDRLFWNPAKEWSGPDVLQDIAQSLDYLGLVPELEVDADTAVIITPDGIKLSDGGRIAWPTVSDCAIHRFDRDGRLVEMRERGDDDYNEWSFLFK